MFFRDPARGRRRSLPKGFRRRRILAAAAGIALTGLAPNAVESTTPWRLYSDGGSRNGTLAERLGKRMEAVERRLGEEVRLDDLHDPATTHLVGFRGKRLRPALVLLAAELGPRPGAEAVLDSAVAVELTHLASLYHDDVMDDAPKAAAFLPFSRCLETSVAILAGDVLFARASPVTRSSAPQAVKLHRDV